MVLHRLFNHNAFFSQLTFSQSADEKEINTGLNEQRKKNDPGILQVFFIILLRQVLISLWLLLQTMKKRFPDAETQE